jgi:glutaminase
VERVPAPDRSTDVATDDAPASPVARYLERLHSRHASLRDGAVATYIPELAKADVEWFGIGLMTVDGVSYETGDTRQPFTIQSISKPLTYGLVLEDLGEAAVRARIGVEPTGDVFNSIMLAPGSGSPPNPMVNSGAIAAASMVRPSTDRTAIERIVEHISAFAGRPLTVDPAVLDSERLTGHRNRAIGHLLRAAGALADAPDETLDRYFAQCSVALDAHDLSVIAATLANDGVNPLDGRRVISPATVRAILSVMTSCGMYDAAGDWLFSVGLPAKSGVSGGLLAVVPGQLGIGIFSPPLDTHGNSVRGVAVCRDLANDLDLHLVGRGRPRVGPMRSRHGIPEIASKRLRTETERARLAASGSAGEVRELQGELTFLAAEAALRGLAEPANPVRWVVLDLRHVERIEVGAAGLIADLTAVLRRDGRDIVLSGAARFTQMVAEVDLALRTGGHDPIVTFADVDLAREWCEDRVLADGAAADLQAGLSDRTALADHELVRNVDPKGLATLQARLKRVCYVPGTRIVRRGETADRLFLIVSGRLSVTVEVGGGIRRLSTLSGGMLFGELSLIGREERSADVHADTMVECLVLEADDFDRLTVDDPVLACSLLSNLLRVVGRTARRMTSEVALLAG